MHVLERSESKTHDALITQPKIKNAPTVGWFKECVHRSRNEIFSEVKTITPAFAEFLLTLNHDNRNVKQVKFQQMVSDMRNDRWALNGESIIFTKEGELNDGQHRLLAVVEAKVSIPMLFTFGVERQTRTTVDQGASRSAGDYLHMSGVPNAGIIAAIARMLLSYEKVNRETLGATNRVTAAEVMERSVNDLTLQTSAVYGQRHAARMRRYLTPAMIAFYHNVLLSQNATEGVAFMEQLCRGEGLLRTDPAFRAREKLLNIGRSSAATKIEIVFRAWNAYRQKRSIAMIPIHGRLPELA